MFNPQLLTFQEYIMQEELPLATIQTAVLEFLQNRKGVALFGAQAVNAYVPEPRMTQDIDILAIAAADLAQELRQFLNERFHIAVRVREVKDGLGYRLYQVRKPKNRHLVAIRKAEKLPEIQEIGGIPVIAPADLIASKIISFHRRRGKPKSGTDWRDLAMLLLQFPELKSERGAVRDRLTAADSESDIFSLWHELVAQEIEAEDEDEKF